jgi:hypothetical protein
MLATKRRYLQSETYETDKGVCEQHAAILKLNRLPQSVTGVFNPSKNEFNLN